jgi:hypothetical protein
MTTVYIQAKTGKQFANVNSVSRSFSNSKNILAKVFLDGECIASSLTTLQEPPHNRAVTIDSSHSRIGGKTFQQRFSFAPLSISKYSTVGCGDRQGANSTQRRSGFQSARVSSRKCLESG